MSLLDTPIARLDGTPSTLGEITGGNPALVVNVASKCGLTPQYSGLEALHEQYADQGFTVVGVPCNQFGGQEPGSPDEIAEFCRRHHIRRLALFGSVLRDDFRPDSDVDVLVEFDPEHIPGLAFFDMQDELSEILERRVDLNTPGFLSPYFREAVLATADVPYDAA